MGAIIPYEFWTKDGSKILIRSANLIDAKAVLQLSKEVISENDTLVTTNDEYTVTEEQQKDFIHIYHADPCNVMIVAENNGWIVGLLTFQRGFLQKYAHHGSIGMIVNRNWRQKGIGKAMLSTLIQWADYNPLLEKLCLEVLASNQKAIALYKSLGFIEEGHQRKQVKLPNGTYDDVILMGKFLNFEF